MGTVYSNTADVSFQFCFLYHIHQKKNTTRFKKWLSNLKPSNLQLPIPTRNNKSRCFKSFYALLTPLTCSRDFAWRKPASLHSRSVSTPTNPPSPRPGKPLRAATRRHGDVLLQHTACPWTAQATKLHHKSCFPPFLAQHHPNTKCSRASLILHDTALPS